MLMFFIVNKERRNGLSLNAAPQARLTFKQLLKSLKTEIILLNEENTYTKLSLNVLVMSV
jgi:hypothetical protein